MEDTTQAALASWIKIAEAVQKGESIATLAKDFETLADFVHSRTPQMAVVVLDVARHLPQFGFKPTAVAERPKKFQRVEWQVHIAKSGKMAGRKHRWTAKFEGLDLRIDHERDVANKVVFGGYINNAKVTSQKMLETAKAEVYAKAIELVSTAAA
ncbi:hypothetical protein ACJMQP_04000 [Rhodopseudomonas palustris]